jgi:hypothetical protein
LAYYQPINTEVRKILAKLTEAKRAGHGEQETTDIVGELYSAESNADMEVTDERINSPDFMVINDFIDAALVR